MPMIESLALLWMVALIIPLIISMSDDYESENPWKPWLLWALSSLIWIVPIFTGIPIRNNVGQYTGYVVAVEENGAVFRGWNVFLKTELESSNEDVACVGKGNVELLERLRRAQTEKENVTLDYEGMVAYAIGDCPSSSWMVKSVR